MRAVHVIAVLTVLCTFHDQLDAETDHLRRSLEREILKHTIHYLKSKLVRCLRQSPGTRSKRFTAVHEMTDYMVDMDILRNSRDYLYSRTLDCLGTLQETAPHKATMVKSKDIAQPTSPPSPHPSTATKWTVAHSPSMNSATRQAFTIDGRQVSCDSASTSSDGTTLLCRNIWVDANIRLPNWSVCPPRYDPTAWWRLNTIQSATFQVLDLESFCHALGRAANIHSHVKDVKVAWDCDRTKPRLKWLNGKWAGEVDDNGFLHDIECAYSPASTYGAWEPGKETLVKR